MLSYILDFYSTPAILEDMCDLDVKVLDNGRDRSCPRLPPLSGSSLTLLDKVLLSTIQISPLSRHEQGIFEEIFNACHSALEADKDLKDNIKICLTTASMKLSRYLQGSTHSARPMRKSAGVTGYRICFWYEFQTLEEKAHLVFSKCLFSKESTATRSCKWEYWAEFEMEG